MTTIAAMVDDHHTVIGADSLSAMGDSATLGANKIVEAHGWVFAVCGAFILKRAIATLDADSCQCPHEIGEALWSWAKERGHEDLEGAIIAARPGEVWLIDGNGCATPHDAIAGGSGRPEALGAIHACRHLGHGAEVAVDIAVRAGIEHDIYSGGRPHVVVMENPK